MKLLNIYFGTKRKTCHRPTPSDQIALHYRHLIIWQSEMLLYK